MKKPELRFEEFNDDWEEYKLYEICNYTTSSLTTSSILSQCGYPLYDANSQIGKVESFHMSEDYITVIKDGAGVGRIRKLPKNTAFIGTMGALTSKNGNLNFLYCLLEKNDLSKQYTGSTIPHIYFKDYGETLVSIPNVEEQKKIGTLFDNLYNLITIHQRKSDILQSLKKSMLEKMFPKEGETKPEIRFEGFTDDWEKHKLSDIYGIIRNAFVGTASPYYVDEGHFYLESNNVKDGNINKDSQVFINDEFYYRQKDKWLHTGDMVMVQSGHVGHSAVIPESLNNTAAHALIMFQNQRVKTNPYFLNAEYQTNKAKKQIDDITKGNTIKHILASDMRNFTVMVPSLSEQNEIADYFRSIDHLLTLHQHKLESLKHLKSALLDKMFV